MLWFAFVLTWTAPAECPDQVALDGRLRALLGGDIPEVEVEVEVAAHVSRDGEGYRARVELQDLDGPHVREIEARSCAQLADAVALMAAVHIEVAVEQAASDEPSPTALPAPPALALPEEVTPLKEVSPPKKVAAAEEVSPRPRTSPRMAPVSDARPTRADRGLTLGLRGGAGAGLPRGVDGWLGLLFAGRWSKWRLEARAEYAPPRRIPFATGVSARYQRLGGGVMACRGFVVPRVELRGCAGGMVAALHGRGADGIPTPNAAWVAWAGPALGVVVAVPLARRFVVTFGGEGAVSLTRPSFSSGVTGVDDLQTAPFAGWAVVGLEHDFFFTRVASSSH